MEYYFEERLHILQCVKFLLSYWQDPRHPYRVGLPFFNSDNFPFSNSYETDLSTFC